jgi:hypothetical protein
VRAPRPCALTGARRGRSVLSLERFPPRAGAHFALEALESMVMSWGSCDVFCYRRRDLFVQNPTVG